MGRSPFSSKEVMNKGTWTAHEDQLLLDYIKVHGEGKWGNVPKETGLKRCGKSCRLRWLNYLRPDIKRGNITQDEEDLIIRLHKLLGNRWSLIAGRLPGRTDNEVKNYWNTILAKRQHGKKAITREASDAHNSDDVAPKKPKVEYYNVAMSPTKDGDQLVNSMAAADSESTDGLSSSSSREENSMDLLIDFDVGDMSLPEFLNLDFAKLSNNGRFNMINVTEGADASDNGCKSTDDQTPVFSGQAFFSPEDMVENWSVSDCIQGIADSDFGSLPSFIQSAEEWII